MNDTLSIPRYGRPSPASLACLATFCLALYCPTALAAYDGVTVEKKPSEVHTRIFDPSNPPKEMPKLEAGEDAVTVNEFAIGTEISTDVISHARLANGNATATVKVTHVTVSLIYKVTIWIPPGCPVKLKAHEEGHHQIAEGHYKTADKVAHDLAKAMVGKTATADAADLNLACRAAIKSFVNDLNDQYMRQVQGLDGRVQVVYDEITHHGTNAVPEDQAIKEAIERIAQEDAAAASAAATQRAPITTMPQFFFPPGK